MTVDVIISLLLLPPFSCSSLTSALSKRELCILSQTQSESYFSAGFLGPGLHESVEVTQAGGGMVCNWSQLELGRSHLLGWGLRKQGAAWFMSLLHQGWPGALWRVPASDKAIKWNRYCMFVPSEPSVHWCTQLRSIPCKILPGKWCVWPPCVVRLLGVQDLDISPTARDSEQEENHSLTCFHSFSDHQFAGVPQGGDPTPPSSLSPSCLLAC
jgi:hypothetical protein